MAIIPQNDPIYHILNNKEKVEWPRPYLGLSMIGESCHRYLQYYHYWAFKVSISTRIDRLFGFGHMMEPQMITDLSQCGIFVTGTQTEIIATAGHWKGHCDGIGVSEADMDQKFNVEFKTHNDKNFKTLVSKGAEAFPKHVHQANSYCGYLDLPYTFYLAYNKNDSKYHYETIQFDIDMFKEDKKKEMEVISSDVLLPRIGNGTAVWHECKMCDAAIVCFKRKKPPVSCRTCEKVDVDMGGRWICSLTDLDLTVDRQKEACDEYELGEMFK